MQYEGLTMSPYREKIIISNILILILNYIYIDIIRILLIDKFSFIIFILYV